MLWGVADPNVLVSALIGRVPAGPPRLLIDAAFEGRWQLVASPRLLAELDEVLHREKFRQWVSIEDAERFVEEVRRHAEIVPDPPQGS